MREGQGPGKILDDTVVSIMTKMMESTIESGTGSGSLAHSLVRTIAPTGHLYTFGKCIFVETVVRMSLLCFTEHISNAIMQRENQCV